MSRTIAPRTRGAPGLPARPAAPLDPRTRAFVLVCFFLSGATGLVYQGIWFRHLQALFGVTTHALAVVVAAFMGGLAAGSWALGRSADRSRRPLRMYGVLELGVAVLAPLVPLGIAGVEHLYVRLHPLLSGSLVWLSLLRLVLALAVLLAPTFLMGGTLPALVVLLRRGSGAARDDTALHRSLGRLYGLNTLGAVAGTGLVGFVLLARFGLWRSTLAAAAVNACIGLWCMLARAAPEARPVSDPGAASRRNAAAADDAILLRFAALAFAVSGALSLAYEVAWTRVLAQIIGSSTYAFSMILAAFLLGLAAGSMALSRWGGRDRAGLWGFCWAELGIGVSASLVVPLLVRLPDLQLHAFRSVQQLGGVLLVQFGLCLLVVFVPTFFMGTTFPLLSGFVAGRTPDVGRAVGRLYAGNTLGGIAGSMLAGFLALPYLGTQRTLLVALLCNVALALGGMLLVLQRERASAGLAVLRRPRFLALGAASVVLIVVALLTPPWDPYLLDAGIAVSGPEAAHGNPAITARDLSHSSDIVFYREGLNANISVRKDAIQLYLKTNGKTDGTTRGDMPTQLMLGLLPALVHPDPRRTLVIGLGTGASARAALWPPELQRLDVVEIEPVVVQAARRWFGAVNSGLFEDGRARIWVDDARAFLLTTPQRYDVIVSEPSNPWIAGVASLFSVEHYRRCAERMQPGAVLAQWLQIYALDFDLVRMVLASMQAVFPHLAVYSFHYGDLIVLASRSPLPPFDLDAVSQRLAAWGVMPQVRQVLQIEDAAGLLGFYLLGEAEAIDLARGAVLNTEDHPRLEFAAPRSLYLPTRDVNARQLRAARRTPLPPLAPGQALTGPDWLDVARGALQARHPIDAQRYVEIASRDASTPDAEARALAAQAALDLGRPSVAVQGFEAALRADAGLRSAQLGLGRLRVMQGRAGDGLALLERACCADSLHPRWDFEACSEYFAAALRTQRAASARPLADEIVAHLDSLQMPDASERALLLGLAARACLETGEPRRAGDLARRSLALDAQSIEAWRVLGTLDYEAQRWADAARWWERLVQYRQTSVDVLLPLANAYQKAGRRRQARRYVEWVLAQEPRQPLALRLQAELR